MDFEDQLDVFFIRKGDFVSFDANKTKSKSRDKFENNTYACIPIMLAHIKDLNNESFKGATNVFKLFSGKVCFKYCLAYGKIIGRGNDSKTMYNYLLDDGTYCLNISVPRRAEDLEAIWKLEIELQAMKNDILATRSKHEIIQSLRNILFKTKQQIDQSSLANGARILLYGKPNYFRGCASLSVFCLIEDNTVNRDIEIAFKDFLIDWFKKNIP